MKSFLTYLKEANNLAPGELYKYDWRLELFIQKFKKGLPLTLVKGGTATLKYNRSIEAQLRAKEDPAKIVFETQEGQTYLLKDFAKTKEFGGGGGSGAGADLTKLTESAQAVYAAARWAGAKAYTPEELKAGYSRSDVSEEFEKILKDLPKEWRESCMLGAEELYRAFRGKVYTFHRGSEWVGRLEKAFKTLNQREKAFSNINKWTPADIWMVSKAGSRIRFEDAKSIADLNGMLNSALKSKDIIGVSLKLVKKKATLSAHNFESKKKTVGFDRISTGSVKGFFGGKDVYVHFVPDGKIQFRTFPETFQGEIKGKNANQGKLSYGPIVTILKSLNLPALADPKTLRGALQSSEEKTMKEFHSNYMLVSNDPKKLSYDEFSAKIKEMGVSWAFSKFLGTQLLAIITKGKAESKFITSCISYASSTSDLSAPFIKVE